MLEADGLEAQLLADPVSQLEDEDVGDGGRVLYRASFEELEDNYVKYEIMQWIMLSLILILAWGAGFLMLLYLPLRRYVLRQDIRSRRLYITSNAIVYKVKRPVFFPCFGFSQREKHILLPLVTDVVIEQGWLQAAYGIYAIRIENAGHRKPPPGDDLQILGVANPRLFRKVVLKAVSNLRRKQAKDGSHMLRSSAYDDFGIEETPSLSCDRPTSQGWTWQQGGTGLSSWQMSCSPMNDIRYDGNHNFAGEALIKKLDEVGNAIKRIEVLVETQHSRSMESFCQKSDKGDPSLGDSVI